MKLVIHDLPEQEAVGIAAGQSDTQFVACSGNLKTCIGCFGCWIKDPGRCILKDELGQMGAKLSKASQIVVISRCYYGGYSPEVKTVMDRTIPYLHPYFQIRNGEMHHKMRYENKLQFRAIFYGDDLTEKEKATARGIVQANSVNIGAELSSVDFFTDAKEVTF